VLTQEENELLTRTDSGTPMGETLRRYWLPALLSSEIAEPDGAPARIKLLGENLVAFRDTSGRAGLLEEFCPHRRVSLWLGRNEENGLRCVYHGWKFDVEGACVDQMNEPEGFAEKVHIVSYPTMELGGIVWAYLGPREKTPPAPKFELTQVPESHRYVTRIWEECNWLQSLEGGVDTSHAPILHRLLTSGGAGTGYSPDTPFVRGKAPTLALEQTEYGYRYAGIRSLDEQGQYVRAYHFVMPFTQIRPQQTNRADGRERQQIGGHFWVPMDDHNCMVWNWLYSFDDEPLLDGAEQFVEAGNSLEDCDPAKNFRKVRNMDIRWGINREQQRTESFTGIRGINNQDHAVQESMGAIVDRSREQLGPADKAVITTRQLLLKAISTVEDGGDPRGADSSYYHLRALERILPHGVDWWEAMGHELDPTFQPA
jgi:phthalate 4,5-dioxygenase oxygenase subunit